MDKDITTPSGTVLYGSCLDRLKDLEDASIDSIVTDPPYELGFMGKKWDASGIAYSVELWQQCLRVLKPGGHLLAFGGTRTYHRMAVAIEDAGFEIRDSIHWVYGSGFPKSLNVGKAIDKQRYDLDDILRVADWLKPLVYAAGVKNVATALGVSSTMVSQHWCSHSQTTIPTLEQIPQLLDVLGISSDDIPADISRLLWELNGKKGQPGENWAKREVVGTKTVNGAAGTAGGYANGIASIAGHNTSVRREVSITAPATDAAKQWEGWGTALKPAHEPIVVARKPLVGTVAANVKEHGTGAINIDGCRIGTEGECFDDLKGRPITKLATKRADESDEEYRQRVLESPGQQKALEKLKDLGRWPANIIFDEAAGAELDEQSGLEASRFFYCPKPAKSERNAGLDHLDDRRQDEDDYERAGTTNPRNRSQMARKNFHPTVKPINLMRYLVRLVTPPNGTVLDPFLGSGTTAAAAILEGFCWTGCEMTDDYLPIITGRIAWAEKKAAEDAPTLPGIA